MDATALLDQLENMAAEKLFGSENSKCNPTFAL